MEEEAKRKISFRRVFLTVIAVILIALVALIAWATWGKNQGNQVERASYGTPNAAETAPNSTSTVYVTSDISPEGLMVLKHAEEIGLGTRSYKLVSIDE